MLNEVKEALGVPPDGNGQRSGFESYSGTRSSVPQLTDTDTHAAQRPNGTEGSTWTPSIERAD